METIRYEDDDGQEREFDVDYKTYDRTVFTVYEDTSFYDYNGVLEFNEDAVMCGANRTECSGVSEILISLNWSDPMNFTIFIFRLRFQKNNSSEFGSRWQKLRNNKIFMVYRL